MDGNEVIEADEDIFEISDFTVVTDLEGLIASLESIFHNVKENWLSATASTDDDVADEESNFLRRKREEVNFHFKERELMLNYFYDLRGPLPLAVARIDGFDVNLDHVPAAVRELVGHELDFCECSSVARQFGVLSYVLIRPINFIIEESDLHTMLSAIEAAALTVDFELPVFLQFGDLSSNLYFGLCKNRNTSTSFESARLRNPINNHKFLNGIKDMFYEKAFAKITSDAEMSVKMDFAYRKMWSTPSLDELEKANCILDGEPVDHPTPTKNLIDYPFGADIDPIRELQLSACWMNVSKHAINESFKYTDAEPLSAPKWFVSVAFHDRAKYISLASMLSALLECREGPGASCLLSSFSTKWTASAANALNAIASNFAVNQLTFRASSSSSIGDEQWATTLKELRYYVNRRFDECLKLTRKSATHRSDPTDQSMAPTNESETDASKDDFAAFQESATNILRYAKGAPVDSLTGYFAQALVAAFQPNVLPGSDLELDAIALLWKKFIDHVRSNWEHCLPLSGLSVGTDRLLDLSQCLLHQKLQMIEVCILTKLERHSTWDSQCEQEHSSKKMKKAAVDEDDEDSFFDASESFAPIVVSNAESDAKPIGRVQLLDESTFLLKYPGERLLYVPITQDFGPMTEDMVEEHTSYLASLDSESGERTRAQLDILLSDMQAFKAANPGAVLEDFVRWHSPRDFDPAADEGRGALSDRMCQADSVWAETWRNAQSLPVSLQSQLFNETKEVETILQYFERLTVAQFIDLLLPVVALDVVRLLIAKCELCPSLIGDRLMALCQRVKQCSKAWTVDDFIEVRNEVEGIEVLISRYNFVWSMMSSKGHKIEEVAPLRKFIIELLTTNRMGADIQRQKRSNHVKVIDAPRGPVAQAIYNCFKGNMVNPEAKFIMPPPIRKQYIFRMINPRPSNRSRPVPHRMYVSVVQDHELSEPYDYHISGSFTSDITFK